MCGIMSPNDTVSNVGIIMLQDDIKATVKMALEEDLGGKLDPSLDVTSQLIDENENDEARKPYPFRDGSARRYRTGLADQDHQRRDRQLQLG